MVDAEDSKSSAARRVGSSPTSGTTCLNPRKISRFDRQPWGLAGAQGKNRLILSLDRDLCQFVNSQMGRKEGRFYPPGLQANSG